MPLPPFSLSRLFRYITFSGRLSDRTASDTCSARLSVQSVYTPAYSFCAASRFSIPPYNASVLALPPGSGGRFHCLPFRPAFCTGRYRPVCGTASLAHRQRISSCFFTDCIFPKPQYFSKMQRYNAAPPQAVTGH